MKTISHSEALELIQGKVKKYGSQVVVAKELDISPAYLSDILQGRREISDNVAKRLGYRKVIAFAEAK